MGEAVNVMGGGNTIINYGLISAVSAPAIWFQDLVVGVPNAIENYGIIESGDRITSNVIGNSGNGAVTFYNHSGASVHGSLNFGGGSDSSCWRPTHHHGQHRRRRWQQYLDPVYGRPAPTIP